MQAFDTLKSGWQLRRPIEMEKMQQKRDKDNLMVWQHLMVVEVSTMTVSTHNIYIYIYIYNSNLNLWEPNYRLFKYFFNVDNVLVWRLKGFYSKSFFLLWLTLLIGRCDFFLQKQFGLSRKNGSITKLMSQKLEESAHNAPFDGQKLIC